MSRTDFNQLLEAGAHFGHLKRKWNPKMAPYIFMEKNGIHIIDLHKTVVKIDEAAAALKQIVKNGHRILFVATKKQAKDVVAEMVAAVNMPYVHGTLAGRYAYKLPHYTQSCQENGYHRQDSRPTVPTTTSPNVKNSRSAVSVPNFEKNLGSIADLTRLPAALFVVDVQKEANAVKEAKRLNIPVFAMVDTCCDPTDIDYVIPANDDATKSIAVVLEAVTAAIAEGLAERKLEKEKEAAEAPKKEDREGKPRIRKVVKAESAKAEAPAAEAVETPAPAAEVAAE